jgi:Fic family protein
VLFKYDPNRASEEANGAKEVYNYCLAMGRGLELLRSGRPICANTAVEIAQVLMGSAVQIRDHGVSLANYGSGEVYYTFLANRDIILAKLRNWENFINGCEAIEPLVRLAVAHYQFEAIHPFPDGNGRTGRILNILLLVQYGFLDSPILYMSRYILKNRQQYYQLLRAVTFHGGWEEWIIFMLNAIKFTAEWTGKKIHSIHDLMEKIGNHIKTKLPKMYSPELIGVIFSQPYCRIRNLVDGGIAKRQTAAKYIDSLVSCGILLEHQSQGPEKLYSNREFMEVLCHEE